jgi:polyhydroxybutyrate depolymerase
MLIRGRNACMLVAFAAALVLGATACSNQSAAEGSSAIPAPSPAVKADWRSVIVDGKSRTYLLVTPLGLDPSQRVPLIVVLHTSGGNAEEMRRLLRFDEEAIQVGFVVAYPQTLNQVWNACCAVDPRSPDDVGFIRQLIDQQVTGGQVDPSRVYATGVSSGGMMTHRLACDLSDRLAAVASIAAELVDDLCNPVRSISVLELHGSRDTVVPISHAYSTMNRWAQLDGCGSNAITNDAGTMSTQAWTGCRDGSAVAMVTFADRGHIWFGPDVAAPVTGPDPTDVIWTFFSHRALAA